MIKLKRYIYRGDANYVTLIETGYVMDKRTVCGCTDNHLDRIELDIIPRGTFAEPFNPDTFVALPSSATAPTRDAHSRHQVAPELVYRVEVDLRNDIIDRVTTQVTKQALERAVATSKRPGADLLRELERRRARALSDADAYSATIEDRFDEMSHSWLP
jgi:hypothetical protein